MRRFIGTSRVLGPFPFPRGTVVAAVAPPRRWASGEDNVRVAAQVLEEEENASAALTHGPLLWIDPLFRPGVAAERARSLAQRLARVDLARADATAEGLMDTLASRGVNAVRVLPRPREGGAFVELGDRADVYRALSMLRRAHPTLEVHQVAGRPFFEDINNVIISRRIKAVFPEPRDAEQVFRLFRPYGSIYGIKMLDAKSADIVFASVHQACRARYCVQNVALPSGAISIEHLPYSFIDWNAIVGLLTSPRMIPLVALAIIGMFIFMIEPVRLFYVMTTISLGQREDLHFDSDVSTLSSGYVDRSKLDNAFNETLREGDGSIWILSSPVGAGKTSFLKHMRQQRRNVVYIDCRGGPLGHKDFGQLLEHMENSIGFWPSFSAISRVLSYIESFLPSKQSVVSKTRETELEGVLDTVHNALRLLRVMHAAGGTPVIVFDEIQDLVNLPPGASQQQRDESTLLIRMLLKWALLTSQVYHTAHVVFVSSNPFASDELLMLNEVRGNTRLYHLGDLDKSEVAKFLRSKLVTVDDEEEEEDDLDDTPDVNAEQAVAELERQSVSVAAESAQLAAAAAARGGGVAQRVENTPTKGLDSTNGEMAQSVGAAAASAVAFLRVLVSSKLWRRRRARRTRTAAETATLARVGVQTDADVAELADMVLDCLGGRISDLDDFCRRLVVHCDQYKESFREATPAVLKSMVTDATRRLLVAGFGPKYFELGTQQGRPWTSVQLWKLISAIAKNGEVPMSDAVVSMLAGNEEALRGMVSERLLNVVERDGTRVIVPASPLLLHVFRDITSTSTFQKRAERMVGQADVESLRSLLTGVEDEFVKLRMLQSWSPWALPGTRLRVSALDALMRALSVKLDAANRRIETNL